MMKKVVFSVVTVLALALLVSSCTFSVGVLPRIGETRWNYSANIDGVNFLGFLAFGKRTNFTEVDGTLTQTVPVSLSSSFSGTLSKYQLVLAPASLGGTEAIRFEGEFQNNKVATTISGKAYYTNDIEADPVVWVEGTWQGSIIP